MKSTSSPKGNVELKLLCCLQEEDSLMRMLQVHLIHGDVINDNGVDEHMFRKKLNLGNQRKLSEDLRFKM